MITPTQSHPEAQGSKCILLADDDSVIREVLSRILRAEGFEVVLARNGCEAIAVLVVRRPDLVLLDLKMPERDGWRAYDVMERVSPLTPVILITALPEQHAQAVRLGIDALMEKPLDLTLLLSTIHKLLAEPEQERLSRLTRGDFKTAHLQH